MRLLRAAFLLLLTGATLNFMVTAALALSIERWSTLGLSGGKRLTQPQVLSFIRQDLGEERRIMRNSRFFGSVGHRFGYDCIWLNHGAGFDATIWRFGWPLRCLKGDIIGIYWDDAETRGFWVLAEKYIIVEGVTARSAGPIMIPLRPIWIGIIGNSLLYAFGLLLLISGSRALLRCRRRRSGGCVKCGYPTGPSAVCSECGTPRARRDESVRVERSV